MPNPKEMLIDPLTVDFDTVFADIEEIRKYCPQRHEMEMLTAILSLDRSTEMCVGYKQTSHDDFWVRGHMPGMPIMPGVMMCEAAAQVATFFSQREQLLGTEMLGFGGLEEVRFRDPVLPGDRLVIACKKLKARKGRMIICKFQGYVRDAVVVEGTIKGVPLPVEALRGLMSN